MSENIPLPNSIRDEMERIYAQIPPDDIPWNIETAPRPLVELVEGGQVKPGKTIDLGCGAGHYAVYLASQGFDVTGGGRIVSWLPGPQDWRTIPIPGAGPAVRSS